jgi:hypothetical protein
VSSGRGNVWKSEEEKREEEGKKRGKEEEDSTFRKFLRVLHPSRECLGIS